MIKKINELSSFASSEYSAENESRSAIKKGKTETQRKNIMKQKSIMKNALMLYDNRTTVTNAFITKNIFPEDVEEDVYLEEKPEHEESTGERLQFRKQRSDELNKVITEKDEIINKDFFKKYFYKLESLSDMLKKFSKTQMA